MLWNRKQSKLYRKPFCVSSRLRMRAFSLCLSLLVGLSACFSRAETNIVSRADIVTRINNLRNAKASMTTEQYLNEILTILADAWATGWFSVPMTDEDGTDYFSDFLARGLFLSGNGSPYGAIVSALLGGSANITTSDVGNNALNPTVRRMESLLSSLATNDQLRVLLQSGFGSVTNDTQHLASSLSNVHDSLISGFYENNWYAANSYWELMDIYSNLTSFVEYVDQSQNSNGSFFPGVGPHVRVMDPVLFQVYETGRLMTTGEESTWLRVKDYDLLYELLQLNSALHALTDFSTNGIPSTNELANANTLRHLLSEVEDFHSDYLSYTYLENDYWEQLLYDNFGYPSGGYRTLSTDMVDLQNALFGNETAQGTNNILSVLKSISTTLNDTSDFSATATNELALTGQAMTNALNAIDASESNVTAYAENPDNEPPYDDDQYKYDGNPLDEFSSQFAGVPLQWTQLYRGAENVASTVTGIELYRGAFPIYGGSSGNRALVQRTVNLPIYYELRDNEPAVAGVMNTTHDIMGWVWDVAAAFLIGWLYKRFAEYMSSQSLT